MHLQYKVDSYEGNSVTRGMGVHEYEVALRILKASKAVKEEIWYDILCLSVCHGMKE